MHSNATDRKKKRGHRARIQQIQDQITHEAQVLNSGSSSLSKQLDLTFDMNIAADENFQRLNESLETAMQNFPQARTLLMLELNYLSSVHSTSGLQKWSDFCMQVNEIAQIWTN